MPCMTAQWGPATRGGDPCLSCSARAPAICQGGALLGLSGGRQDCRRGCVLTREGPGPTHRKHSAVASSLHIFPPAPESYGPWSKGPACS